MAGPTTSNTTPPDMATSLRILRQGLDTGFDPVKLAALRNERIRENEMRMANLAGSTDARSQAEMRRQGAFRSVTQNDADTDPFTGLSAQADLERRDDTLQDADTYFMPSVTQQREDDRRAKLRLASEPARVTGLAARDVAAITAKGKADAANTGWAEPTVSIPDPYGTGGTYPVPRRIAQDPAATRKFIDAFRANGVGAMQGQADRSKINAFNTLIDVMGDTYRAGEAAKWQGTGPIANGILAPIYRKTNLFSNPAEEDLRTKLGRVKTREAFGEGGKAFTGTEQKLVDEFLASAYDNSATVKTRLDAALQHAADTLRNLGVSDAEIDARIQSALGGARSFGGGAPSGPGADIADPNWGR